MISLRVATLRSSTPSGLVPTFFVLGRPEGRPLQTRVQQPLEQIRAIAERVAASRGLEIWDIQSRREASGHVVRVFIDRPGPAATAEESVSIEDCEQVNREMSTILDVEDPLPFAYTLEVSSPGLDRPLRDANDYRRFAGRWAKVVVSEAVDNQKAFEGRLEGVEDDAVLLEAPNGRVHRLPLRLVTRGRLEVEF
ncbi:MAG: ribosome maturation factor RimP [Phycisphaerae bacterium]|nr:ribosome maturation factor RimP [Phycisphaerae bacterium]